MYLRFLNLKAKSGKTDLLESFYTAIAIPELQKVNGCQFAALINSSSGKEDYISLTIWKDRRAAMAYADGETYRKLNEQGRAFLQESSEWKVQLSDKMELEYAPVNIDPQVDEFHTVTETDSTVTVPSNLSSIYVRLVTHRIDEGKKGDFLKIYEDSIIPFFRDTAGCLFASLIENREQEDEVVSMTIWDSKEKMESYEKSGDFENLLKKLQPTFSQFFQWKVAMEERGYNKIQTNKDIRIQTYKLVSGKKMD